MVERGVELAVADDADAQIGLRRVRARLPAETGDLADAEGVAREAVARAEAVDYLESRAQALSGLAEVLSIAGKLDEAADAFERAAAVHERKGNLVLAARARARLEDTRPAAPG